MEVLRYVSDDGLVEIKVATSDISQSWKRFKGRIRENAATYCDYRASRPGSLWLACLESLSEVPKLVSPDNAAEWLGLPPVFYETNVYTFTLRFKGIEEKPSILHPSQEVVDQFNWFDTGPHAALITGSINFLNEPGIFNLRYKYKPAGKSERVENIEFRVVSPKLDTKEDYQHILQAINREYENLAYKYLTKTFQNFQIRGSHNQNDLIWLSIFRTVVDDYIKAMQYIVNKPHIREQRQERFSRADRIKQWTPAMAEKYHQADREQTLETKLFRHEVAISTLNTRENRFVKYTIENIGKKLTTVLTELNRNYGDQLSETEKSKLLEYQTSISKLIQNRFFRSIGPFEGFKQESLVLQKRTGYAQVYRAWFMLSKSLDMYQGNTQIGTRPIWELYELWCFLKMKQLITDILDIAPGSEHIKEEKSAMLDPFKESNVEHTVIFQKEADGDKIELKYQHTYNRHSNDDGVHTATTEQRPDIVLNITKPDGFTLTYLYDAKYRVLDDKNANETLIGEPDGEYADYPPTDAINQMHRYRDAIYYGSNLQAHSAKEIIGGYILFPGRTSDSKARERYYFKSIETVNIGAFPLLPSKNGVGDLLLREHLASILLVKTKYEHIKDSIPQRGLKYISETQTSPADIALCIMFDNVHDIVRRPFTHIAQGLSLSNSALRITNDLSDVSHIVLHNKRDYYVYRVTGAPRLASKTKLADDTIQALPADALLKLKDADLFLVYDVDPAHITDLPIDSNVLASMKPDLRISYYSTMVPLQKLLKPTATT